MAAATTRRVLAEDANTILLEHVERLARELREVRDDQREILSLLDRRRAESDRRRQYRRDDPGDRRKDRRSDGHKDGHSDAEKGGEVSPSHTLPFPTPKEINTYAQSENKTFAAAPATPFVDFVVAEWPDLRDPAAFEQRAIEAFPGVNVLAEVKKARGWEMANPTKAKKRHGKFFWSWLTTAQDNVSKVRTVDFDAAAKERADKAAWKQLNDTQTLLKKQDEERPDRTKPDEAKKRIGMLVGTVLANQGKGNGAGGAQ